MKLALKQDPIFIYLSFMYWQDISQVFANANPPVTLIIKYAGCICQVANQCYCHHYLFSSSQESKIVDPIVDVITIRLRHLLQSP
jgi:hypothetical protein